MDCQGSHAALSSFIFISKNPDISRGRHDSSKQQVIEEGALGGIRTGSNFPTGSIPMQKQCHLMSRSVGREVGTESVDVISRICRDSKKAVRLTWAIGPNIRAWHYRPGCAIPVQDQRKSGGLPRQSRRREA